MNDLCESCIKRKTMYCPNSNECHMLDDRPHYLGKYRALIEIERLNNIINSFEKYLEENDAKYTLSKLKELKGDDKDEI